MKQPEVMESIYVKSKANKKGNAPPNFSSYKVEAGAFNSKNGVRGMGVVESLP